MTLCLVGLAAALLLPTLATRPAVAYSVLLPDVQPSPSLPYVAEKDHYSGPAGIQILVKAPDYSYYLMLFKDHRLAAIFNAYDGSFEELRYFERPQRYVTESKVIRSILSKALRQYKAEVVEMSTPEIRYDQKLPGADRFSPRWEVRAVVRDARGTVRRVPVSVSAAGRLISSLDELKETDRQKTKM